MSFKATLSGLDELRANIRRFQGNKEARKSESLRRIAKKIFDKSQEYVPKNSEDLMESAQIVESVKGQSVSVTYDGPYAIAVHEHLSDHSPHSWKVAEAEGHPVKWSEPGTGPKYLERPWMEESNTYAEDLGEDLQVEKIGL